MHGYQFLDTAIGRCAIGWSDAGITGLLLPQGGAAALARAVRSRFAGLAPATPPPLAGAAMAAVTAMIEGQAVDLDAIVLDQSAIAAAHRRVFDATRRIAPGTTATCAGLAAQIGAGASARQVGQALAVNPFAPLVPCHRVLASDGRIGAHWAPANLVLSLRLLRGEHEHARRPAVGATFDVQAALAHLRRDRAMARIIDRVGPWRARIGGDESLFDTLARAIVYQQLHGRAAATIHARLRALFPRPHAGLDPARVLRTADARLRGAGLSSAKLLALRDLARRSTDGALPTPAQLGTMDDEAVIAALTQVRGIGRWTAQMLLMFQLGRPDVLPLDDFGLRRGLAVLLGRDALPTREELQARARRWAPYRSVASWYLWQAADQAGT